MKFIGKLHKLQQREINKMIMGEGKWGLKLVEWH